MSDLKKFLLPLMLFIIAASSLYARSYLPGVPVVALSAVKGQQSKPQTIELPATSVNLKGSNFKITGAGRNYFTIVSFKNKQVVIAFSAPANTEGIQYAKLTVSNSTGKIIKTVNLSGLRIDTSDTQNEPPLSTIVEALGFQINIGWQKLANHSRPELLGDEIDVSLFKKAGKGPVKILPVGRFSPDFELPFGYYINTSGGPAKNQAGILAKSGKYVQHQTLYPDMASGSATTDPGVDTFGFYVSSPDHNAYSEDVWNMVLHPDNAVRAARIYPVKDKNNALLKNTYLICFEAADKGGYNDIVFLVENVAPATENLFTTIFDGKSLNGWHSYLKDYGLNNDPNKNFRLEDGTLHVIGKDLGYEISEKGFFNFHAKLQFKWGVTKWPPRQNAKRDGGFLYNIPMAEPDSIWPKSIECQIQEGDVGDFWMLGFSTLTVDGKTNKPTNHIQFVKKRDNEKPYGEWNTVEVISYNGRCVQIVNGVVVNYGDNSSSKGGRVILQSEYSEIYYRDVKIRQL